jgi:Fe-S cluster assembly scaffold protein SufB
VAVDADKFTAYTELYQKGGYFIRILPGAKVELPIQSCLMMSEHEGSQRVHNIIIAEEGSSAEIISGCTTVPQVETGMHLGVSEFYIKKGAHLSFTMIHNWAENFYVRPRTGALLEDDASFINNYILLKPVKSLQSNPRAILKGKRSRVRFNSIIHGRAGSVLDLGSVLELIGEDSRGEAVSRAAAGDDSCVLMRGKLLAFSNSAQARLECKGMLLSDQARMQAIPELEVVKAPRADLNHEAAVGPISRAAVEYLMARGLTEEEATSLIIQGFMKVGITGLPEILEKMVDEMAESISKGGL